MDVYRFHARKQKATADPNIAKWAGGDTQDRLEYIKAKKQEMGEKLDKVLSLSSKRSVDNHKLKGDMACIEFDGLYRNLHINEGWI